MKRAVIVGLPVVFLVMHLLQLPLVVPSFLLPSRAVFAGSVEADPQGALAALRRHRRLLVRSGDSVRELRSREVLSAEDLVGQAGSAPQGSSEDLPQLLSRAAAVLPPLCRMLCLADRLPSAAEIEGLRALQRSGLPPVQLRMPEPPGDPLLLGCSYSYGTRSGSVGLQLAFAPRVGAYDRLRVRLDGRLLWDSPPADMAEGRQLQLALPAPPGGTAVVELEFAAQGRSERRSLRIDLPEQDTPPVLFITDKPVSRSFLDALYGLKRVSAQQARRESLVAYPLVVMDGVPLRELGAELSAALAELHHRRSSSLLFVADGPRFAARGDSPPIEEILPVELLPRSLRHLPDLGILTLLDVSASMMGDKLSLAKVSTLQLLRNLKDTDRVSILAFWDSYQFLRGFEQARSLGAEAQLAPLLAQGGTDMHKALSEGLARLAELDMPEKHVILITDGKTKEGDFGALTRRARSLGITISALAVGQEVNVELLSRIAQQTGGRYYRVSDLESIPTIIFEDRRQIARSTFARETFPIRDAQDLPAGSVSGMSLFTPRPGSALLYRNPFDDPLLIVQPRDRQFTGLFLSDLYGTYTAEFLTRPEVTATLQALFDPVLRPSQLTVRVGEAHRSLSVTVGAQGLVEPRVELYRDNRVAAEQPMEAGAFGTWHAQFPVSGRGPLTLLLYSQGRVLARLPVHFNGAAEGVAVDAVQSAARYRPAPFLLRPPGRAYLVFFFLASLAVTWWARGGLRAGGSRS